MSTLSERQTRKLRATRQGISDVATRLFIERGFDNVTVDEIAAAADVGRMTVFNHFPRKEDMFFDLDEQGRAALRDALRRRDPAVSPIEALRLFAHQVVAEARQYIEFSARTQAFNDTILGSESLKARARAIQGELARLVADELAAGAGRASSDVDADLAASLLLATWAVALNRAHRVFRDRHDSAAAKNTFMAIVDRGTIGLKAAMAGTPYV